MVSLRRREWFGRQRRTSNGQKGREGKEKALWKRFSRTRSRVQSQASTAGSVEGPDKAKVKLCEGDSIAVSGLPTWNTVRQYSGDPMICCRIPKSGTRSSSPGLRWPFRPLRPVEALSWLHCPRDMTSARIPVRMN